MNSTARRQAVDQCKASGYRGNKGGWIAVPGRTKPLHGWDWVLLKIGRSIGRMAREVK